MKEKNYERNNARINLVRGYHNTRVYRCYPNQMEDNTLKESEKE